MLFDISTSPSLILGKKKKTLLMVIYQNIFFQTSPQKEGGLVWRKI